jgi:hypothetical protein
MPNLIVLNKDEIEKIISDLKLKSPSPYIDGLINGYSQALSLSTSAETVIGKAYDAGRKFEWKQHFGSIHDDPKKFPDKGTFIKNSLNT